MFTLEEMKKALFHVLVEEKVITVSDGSPVSMRWNRQEIAKLLFDKVKDYLIKMREEEMTGRVKENLESCGILGSPNRDKVVNAIIERLNDEIIPSIIEERMKQIKVEATADPDDDRKTIVSIAGPISLIGEMLEEK